MPMPQRFGIVESQHFDIRYSQVLLLDGSHDFRKRRHVASGKNVFRYPGVRGAGRRSSTDRVNQRDAVALQQPPNASEIFPIMRHADMLEHAHRDNAVELGADRAVIRQRERGLLGEARFASSQIRSPVLVG